MTNPLNRALDISAPVALHAESTERARELGLRLRAPVVIDETGWLRGEVELVFTKKSDRTLRPVMVRVGREVTDTAVMADGGVIALCERYNAALSSLRRLAATTADLGRIGKVILDPSSPASYAHTELSRIDELIEQRQQRMMGHGVVQLTTLRHETEFFMSYDASLAPLVDAAASRAAQVDELPRTAGTASRSHHGANTELTPPRLRG